QILPNYVWDSVVTDLRHTILDAFSFDRRELGQPALLSEVISVMQSVKGVAYVDVDAFGGVPEKKTGVDAEGTPTRVLLTPKEISVEAAQFLGASATEKPLQYVPVNFADFEDGVMRPAQLAYLTPDVEDTLVLNQVTLR